MLLSLTTATLVAGCSDDSESLVGIPVQVRIMPEQTGSLDPRYVGYAFDTAQFTAGMWWSVGATERAPAPTPDLESPRLRAMASLLAPSVMRVGGTDCDAYYFCPEPGECEVPEAYRGHYSNEIRFATVLTHDDVRRMASFADAVDAQVLMCINVGPGPRDPQTGAWDTENARALISFIAGLPQRDRFTLWEPGNEINTLPIVFNNIDVTPESVADEIEQLVDLLQTDFPGVRVAAPGSFIFPFGEVPLLTEPLMDELDNRPAGLLDIVSWHLYATQSTACSALGRFDDATPENLLSDELMENHRGIAREINEVARGRPVWNTESASAQCGGQQNVSDVMVDALWYMDWYGVLAEEGTELIVRHSLVGADYSLLEPDDFAPRPTFWALALMRHTVEGAHFTATWTRRSLRAHAYCAPQALGAVTAVVINRNEPALLAEIALESQIETARYWRLSTNGDLQGRVATINGVLPDAELPEPQAARVEDGIAKVELGAYEMAFVVLETADGRPAACR